MKLKQNKKRIRPIDFEVVYDVIELEGAGDVLRPGASMVNDIERKYTEEPLRLSERNYREIFDATGDAIFIHDGETGRILDVNRVGLEIFGYSHEELLKLTVEDISSDEPPYSQEEALRKIRNAVEKGPQVFDWKCKKNKGEYFWASVSLKSSRIGGKGRVLAAIRDITKRKQAEEELRKQLELNQTFIQSSPAFFVAIESAGRVMMMNESMLKALGYTSNEVTGADYLTTFIPEKDREQVTQIFKTLLSSGESTTNENHVLTKSGGKRLVEWYGHNIINSRDEIDYFFGVGLDITERKRAEEEKKKLERQLQHTQKMESIGKLAGGIAHDFNNLLSPILIHSEMAMMDLPSDSPLQFNMKQILDSGKRARDLVKQILTFGRKDETPLTEVRVAPIIEETLKMLRSTTPATIKIVRNIEKENDAILSNPSQIQQIILNLCTNAVHAMKEQGGTLKVGLKDMDIGLTSISSLHDLKPGAYIKLRVEDTGCGIDEKIIENVFEPYYTTKEEGEGSGLGLAVVHGIVKELCGDIQVQSEIGKGTKFDVFLPRIGSEPLALEIEKNSLMKGFERILFVDDEEVNVEVHGMMLESLGYSVTSLTDSMEALEIFRSNPSEFDLVITDMTMPEMTGKDLGQELISIRPDIPIILCTGFSEQIDENMAKEIGIKALIMKPITIQVFADKIREVLD